MDHATFEVLRPEDAMIPSIYRAIEKDKISKEQIMTMPAVLYGFHLSKKVWGECDGFILDYGLKDCVSKGQQNAN